MYFHIFYSVGFKTIGKNFRVAKCVFLHSTGAQEENKYKGRKVFDSERGNIKEGEISRKGKRGNKWFRKSFRKIKDWKSNFVFLQILSLSLTHIHTLYLPLSTLLPQTAFIISNLIIVYTHTTSILAQHRPSSQPKCAHAHYYYYYLYIHSYSAHETRSS